LGVGGGQVESGADGTELSEAAYPSLRFARPPFLPVRVLAWSGAGHQVIAVEAYHQLSPGLQKKVTEILKAHPDYEKWEKSFASESPNLDLPTFIFMR
jgi:hypothetical protein